MDIKKWKVHFSRFVFTQRYLFLFIYHRSIQQIYAWLSPTNIQNDFDLLLLSLYWAIKLSKFVFPFLDIDLYFAEQINYYQNTNGNVSLWDTLLAYVDKGSYMNTSTIWVYDMPNSHIVKYFTILIMILTEILCKL